MLLTYLQLVYGGQVVRIQNSETLNEKYIAFEYSLSSGMQYVIVFDEFGKEIFNSKENQDKVGFEDITNDGNLGVYAVYLNKKLYCLFDINGRAYFPASKHNWHAVHSEEIYQLVETTNTLIELIAYGDSEYPLEKPVSQIIDFSTGAVLLETMSWGNSLLKFLKINKGTAEKSLYIYDLLTNKSIKYNYNKDRVEFTFEWGNFQEFIYKVRPLVHKENGNGDISYYIDASDMQDDNTGVCGELFADTSGKVCIDNTYKITRAVDKDKHYVSCCNGLMSVSDGFAFSDKQALAFRDGTETKIRDLVSDSAGYLENYKIWYNLNGSCVFIITAENEHTPLKSSSKSLKYSGTHVRTVLYAFNYDYNKGLVAKSKKKNVEDKNSNGDRNSAGVELILKTGYISVDYGSDLTVAMAVDYNGEMQSYIVYKDRSYVYFVNSKTGLATVFSYDSSILGDFGVNGPGDLKTVIDSLDRYVAGGRLEENGEPEFDISSIQFTDNYQDDCGVIPINMSASTADMREQALIKEIVNGDSCKELLGLSE